MRPLKIYMAGPQCFYPDSSEVFAHMCQIVGQYGFTRSDTQISFEGLNTPKQKAKAIFEANISSIKNCDVIVADINNFRGCEPDSGTCFELGAAYIWGKPLYCYIGDARSCVEKFSEPTHTDQNGRIRDVDNLTLEKGCANLMLTGASVVVQGTFEDAIKQVFLDFKD